MNSLSSLVLVWMFGTWMFGPGELAALPNEMAKAVSPLTIFASYFSIVGVAMFGLLGSWAIFLGIFRLRQNGNFFGSRDGNEAFFYPMRMVMAMVLCAPVIPVASQGGDSIVLTPGHHMIASLAKSGSKWGDDAQAGTFRQMNTWNLFNEPNYFIEIEETKAKELVASWAQQAAVAAGYYVHKDAHNTMAAVTPNQFAEMLAVGAWNAQHPNNTVTATSSPFINQTLGQVTPPQIPPNDAIATEMSINGAVSEAAVDGTTSRELNSESWLCSLKIATSISCSDEMLELRKNNSQSIARGLAHAQRLLWQKMVEMEVARHNAIKNNIDSTEWTKLKADTIEYHDKLSKWYADTARVTIQTALATELQSDAKPYFEQLQQWGWMMGGTFVLRAANDFTRAQDYASKATSQLLPKGSLASLTVADDLTKLTVNSGEKDYSDNISTFDLGKMFGFSVLQADPAKANLFTVSQFGRQLMTAGIAFMGIGSAAKLIKLEKISGFSLLLGIVLVIFGLLVGYVLPAVFAVYGLMGVISWLTFVASAFFGVTLWGAAFAAPKGEEHTSQMAGKGWNILVFIGFYPALAVAGLAAAVTITSISLPLVNILMSGLWGMSDSGVADSRVLNAIADAIAGMAVIALLTCFLFWSVCMTSASLITTFPRTVLNMISFSEPGLNPYENTAQGIMGGLSGMIKAPMSIATNSVIRRFTTPRNLTSPNSGAGGTS